MRVKHHAPHTPTAGSLDEMGWGVVNYVYLTFGETSKTGVNLFLFILLLVSCGKEYTHLGLSVCARTAVNRNTS